MWLKVVGLFEFGVRDGDCSVVMNLEVINIYRWYLFIYLFLFIIFERERKHD